MLFGAHVSIAGGVQNAPRNAAALGCEVFQMFTRSPQGSGAQKITPELVQEFLTACKKHKFTEWVVHAPYYLNFASNEERVRKNSARILREELERSAVLHARYLMFHVGSARTTGRRAGLRYAISGLQQVLADYHGKTKLLLEISAGAGEIIGDTFEEIASLIQGVEKKRGLKNKLGVCLDTQHAFASGYDLRTAPAVDMVLKKFAQTIGLSYLCLVHCNDSQTALGSHKDRHEHLGRGQLGSAAFAALVGHPLLQDVNFYCETEHDLVRADLALLKKLRG